MGVKGQAKSYGSRGGKRIVNLPIDEETARHLLYLLTAALGGGGGLKGKQASPKGNVGAPKGSRGGGRGRGAGSPKDSVVGSPKGKAGKHKKR